MTLYKREKERLKANPGKWLVTGVAGFIGSNLLESLLRLDQQVVGLDNFSTGKRANLEEVRGSVSSSQWARFRFVEGDIREPAVCASACSGRDYVLHQAALGSVPRSIANPLASHDNNVTGAVNMLVAARDAQVSRFVYASSSSVYGDHPELPKREENTGECLSPYAVTKEVCELYASVFTRCYGLPCIGLRYFNVFGPRQDPDGPYAAVIPKWIAAMIAGESVVINGDGETSRDFCFVENAVQANILAAVTRNPEALGKACNTAVHARATLNQLYALIHTRLATEVPHLEGSKPVHRAFRKGDVRHSEADISRARDLLGYSPSHTLEQGLDAALGWYLHQARDANRASTSEARSLSSP